MTDLQSKVYNEIKKYIEVHNFPPTVRELCELCNKKSTATIVYYLRRLKKKGYITYEPTRSRTIRIIKEEEC